MTTSYQVVTMDCFTRLPDGNVSIDDFALNHDTRKIYLSVRLDDRRRREVLQYLKQQHNLIVMPVANAD